VLWLVSTTETTPVIKRDGNIPEKTKRPQAPKLFSPKTYPASTNAYSWWSDLQVHLGKPLTPIRILQSVCKSTISTVIMQSIISVNPKTNRVAYMGRPG